MLHELKENYYEECEAFTNDMAASDMAFQVTQDTQQLKMAHQHWLEQSSLDVVAEVSSFEILPESPEPLE